MGGVACPHCQRAQKREALATREHAGSGTALALRVRTHQRVFLEVPVTRTIGAAIGALLFVFFMSFIATRLAGPVPTASTARVEAAGWQR